MHVELKEREYAFCRSLQTLHSCGMHIWHIVPRPISSYTAPSVGYNSMHASFGVILSQRYIKVQGQVTQVRKILLASPILVAIFMES